MKKLLSASLGSALLFLPLLAGAATYHYIDLTGQVQTVEAANASVALTLARGFGNIWHSGVKLDMGLLDQGQEYGHTYSYIDVLGNQRTVVAASVDAARTLATDRDPNSGFLILGP